MNDSFHQVARDIRGAEGPCVNRSGRIFMVGPDDGRVVEILGDGTPHDLANTGGKPAGLQSDRNGDLWVADMELGILKVTMSGEIVPVVTEFENKPMRGCNDLAFDAAGNLFFSAPAGWAPGNACGELYSRDREGTVRRLDAGFEFSNGLAVTADSLTLILAETFTKRLFAYDIVAPGVVANRRLWAMMPGEHYGGCDGMDFDSAGNLLAANWGAGALEIFDPDGRHLRTWQTPFLNPSNLHFCGPGTCRLLVTEHNTNGLWEANHTCPGQTQYGW